MRNVLQKRSINRRSFLLDNGQQEKPFDYSQQAEMMLRELRMNCYRGGRKNPGKVTRPLSC